MKKYCLIFAFLTFAVSGFSQHPLGESQLLVGNGYFQAHHQKGDGTWRYAEARVIPGQHKDVRYGLYLSAIEVASKIDGYKHHSTEFGVGLAVNFNLAPGWKYDRYGWSNIGYKHTNSNGEMRQSDGLFENSQSDDLMFITAGLIFQNTMEIFPFIRHKVSVEYQLSVKSKIDSEWKGKPIMTQAWDNERLKINFENAVAKINLSWRNDVHLLPAIYLGYSYEQGGGNNFGALGAVITLAKGEYGREVLNLSYQSKFAFKGKERINLFEINFNILSIFR